MSLTPALVRWLQGDDARAWLEALTRTPPQGQALLPTLTRLRQTFTPAQASALVTLAQTRHQAQAKFGDQARTMFFSPTTLQQASPWPVAQWTARRFADYAWVADLGCGAGADTLALAQGDAHVLAVDLDPLALALTQANARAWHLAHRVAPIQADVRQPAWALQVAWADPGRRQGERRIFQPHALQPPLADLLALQARRMPHMGIKLMPGLPHDAIPPHAEAEWISLHGALKEAVLWLGDLARRPGRCATILPGGHQIWAEGAQADIHPPGAFLCEPDPAVLRAGAVGDLAQRMGWWQMDAQIAYLSAQQETATPFARCWPILEHHPFDLKTLNRRLRALRAQVVAVKKRGSPIEPEPFRKRLAQTPQGRPVIVFLHRVMDRPWMTICAQDEPATGAR